MEITGVTLDEFTAIVYKVSERDHDGNLIVHRDAHDQGGKRRPRITARLAALDSRGAGTRTSWTGRRGPWACWHAYRDVLAEVFAAHPTAVIRTGMAVYNGAEGFAANYPATAYHNIGSQVAPAYMPELCECV
jgi:hypothetical protein